MIPVVRCRWFGVLVSRVHLPEEVFLRVLGTRTDVSGGSSLAVSSAGFANRHSASIVNPFWGSSDMGPPCDSVYQHPDSGGPNHFSADPVPAEIRRAGNPPPRVFDTIASVKG